MRDPYAVLGVAPGAPDTEVKAAWRRLVLESHPDKAQSRGASAVDAAEAATKRINEAYAEVRRRRAQAAGKRSTGTAYDRTAAPPMSAGDAMHRARAALDFAESLVERWQRHVSAVRQSLQDAQRAAQTAIDRGEELAQLRARCAVAKETIEAAAVQALDVKLVAPARRATESAELVAQGDTNRPQVAAQLNRLADEVNQALMPAPAVLGDAITAARNAAHTVLQALTDAVRGRSRLMRDVSSAAKRAREASRNARRRLDEFERVVELAADVVERGVVLAGIAVGLSQVERDAAEGPEDETLADVARTQARALWTRAETLYAAQERASADAIRAREQLHVSEGLAQRAKETARVARADVDVLEVGADEATTFAASIGPAQLARVDGELRDLLARVRLAAGS